MKANCSCGEPLPSAQWTVVATNDWEWVQLLESRGIERLLLRDVSVEQLEQAGDLLERARRGKSEAVRCAACGRLHWREAGQTEYTVFMPNTGL